MAKFSKSRQPSKSSKSSKPTDRRSGESVDAATRRQSAALNKAAAKRSTALDRRTKKAAKQTAAGTGSRSDPFSGRTLIG